MRFWPYCYITESLFQVDGIYPQDEGMANASRLCQNTWRQRPGDSKEPTLFEIQPHSQPYVF